jgi:hypothetical protein
MLGLGLGLQFNWGVGVRFDSDYQSVLDYGTAEGYALPSEGQQVKQNNFMLALKSAGVWAKLDSLRVYATNGDANFALIDWVRLVTCTAVNSPPFTTNVGYRGNGTSARIDTGYVPSTDAVNLSLNSGSMFMYRSAARTAGQVQAYEGTVKSGEGFLLTAGGPTAAGECYINSTGAVVNTGNGGIGFQLVNRVNSTTLNIYFNGILNNQNTGISSTSIPSVSVWDFSANNGSTGTFFSDVGSAVKGIGSDLTAEQGALNTAVQNYMISIQEFLLQENGDFILQENDSKIIN